MKFKHSIYNICANDYVDIFKLKEKILAYFPGSRSLIKNTPANKADVLKTHGSNIKIKKVLGDYKFIKINLGLKKTIKWFFENSANI